MTNKRCLLIAALSLVLLIGALCFLFPFSASAEAVTFTNALDALPCLDGFLLQTGTELQIWTPASGITATIPLPDSNSTLRLVQTEEERVLLYSATPGEGGDAYTVQLLSWQPEGSAWQLISSWTSPVLWGDLACISDTLYGSRIDAGGTLWCKSLKGQGAERQLSQQSEVIVGMQGTMLMIWCRQPYSQSLRLYDTAAGKTISEMKVQGDTDYFFAEDTVYVLRSPWLYLCNTRMQGDGRSFYLPQALPAPLSGRSLAINTRCGWIVCHTTEGLEAYPLTWQVEEETASLHILSTSSAYVELVNAASTAIGLPVRCESSLNASPPEIASQFRTGDNSADAWIACSTMAGFRALLQKGFPREIGSQHELFAQTNEMHHLLRGIVQSADGRLYGLPVGVDFSAYQAIALHDMEKVDLFPLEGDCISLTALLPLLTEAYRTGQLQDMRLFDAEDQREALLRLALRNYMLYCVQPDDPAPFDTPLFRELLEEAEALFDAMQNTGNTDPSLPYLLQQEDITQASMADYNVRWTFLTPDSSLPPRLFAGVWVMLFNPLSYHAEDAVRLALSCWESLSPFQRLLLWPEKAVPVEDAKTVESILEAEAEIAEWESLLDQLRSSGDVEQAESVQAELARMLHEKEVAEKTRWLLTQEEIDQWKAILPLMQEEQEVFLSYYNEQSFRTTWQQYLDGLISTPELIDWLNHFTWMYELEGR